MYTHRIKLDVTPGGAPKTVHVSQYDKGSRTLEFELYSTGAEFTLPSGATAEINGTKPDGNGFSYVATLTDNVVSVELTEQMAAVAGKVPCKIVIEKNDKKLLTEKFILSVDRAALDKDTLQSTSEVRQLVEIMDNSAEIIEAANTVTGAVDTVSAAAVIASTAAANAASAKTAAEAAQSAAETAAQSVAQTKEQIEEEAEGIVTQRNEALTAIREAKESAVGVVDDKAQAVVQMKSNAEAVAAQALRNANNLANTVEDLGATIDEQNRAIMMMRMQMDQKVDGGYADAQGYLHLTSNGEDVSDGIGPFAGGSGGGGGGGAETNAVMTASNITGWISKTIAEGDTASVSITWSSTEEEMSTGKGILTVIVGDSVKTTMEVDQGTVVTDISKYLTVGSNSVSIQIADIYGQKRRFNFVISVIAISISSTFDTSEVFEGPVMFPFTPIGRVRKTVYCKVDGREVDSLVTSASGSQMTFMIPQQTHGAHSVECYFECEINEQAVESNHLYFEITCVEPLNNAPIITSSYAAETVDQYSLVVIPFRVYSPASDTAEVELSINNTLVSTQTVNRTEQVYSYRADTAGVINFRIVSGTASKTISFTVRESDIYVEPVSDSLALQLDAKGRSNNEATRDTWEDGNVSATLSGFNWRQNGWLTDEDGADVLRLNGDARVSIPYKLFERNFISTGLTVELEFATRQVSDYTATILSCFSDNVGLKVTPQNVLFKGPQSEINAPYKDNEHIHLTITVDKQTENRMILVYIDGIASEGIDYAAGERFSQLTPVDLTIGSNHCGIDIYGIRIYHNNLNMKQVVNNWIADTQDGALMLERYTRNQVYNDAGDVAIEHLPADLAYMVIEAPEMPQYKGDKKTVTGYFVDPVYIAKSFTFNGCEIDVQGTSSAIYWRKNIDMKFKAGFTMTATGATVDAYGMRDNSIPFNRFVVKMDVASSESANNTGLVEFFHRTCPYKTQEMISDPRVRHGIEGRPIVLFWLNTDTQVMEFIGKGNFNLPKRAAAPYGYTGNMESWEWERNNSQNVKFQDDDFESESWDEVNQNYYPAWYDDFEARFPSDEWRDYTKLKELISWVVSTDRTQATGEDLLETETFRLNTTITVNEYGSDSSYTVVDEVQNGQTTGYKIFSFTKDTPAYRLTKFRAEFGELFEVDSAAFYYLITELLLMIDSRAKNMFIGFKGSPVTKEGSSLDRKAVFEPYDMDTAIGTNNSGVLMFSPFLEDTDTVSSVISGSGGGSNAPVFNAQDSVLWMNFRDSFRAEITAMYRSLRAGGMWSYNVLESLFEEHQSKWPEAIFNADAYSKYILPLVNPVTIDESTGQLIRTNRYLTMLQGSKTQQRKWWLSNRFRYMDSKFVTGDAANKIISLRIFGSGTLTLTPAIDMYVGVSFGGGTTPALQRTAMNTPVSFPYITPSGVTEMETWIYSADLITDVGDLSVFYPNELDFSKATKLKRLKIGSNESGYSNANLRTLDVRNSELLESIDCRNCPNLAITVNLEGSPRLEEAYFDGTAITGVDLADGGVLETLHLPATITTLTLLNLGNLTDLTVASYANVTRLMLANMDDSVVDVISILEEIPANSQVYIEGLNMEAANAAEIDSFLDLLDTMRGVTRERASNGEWLYHDYDKAQVSGRIHTSALTGAEVAELQARYPYIRIVADHVTSYITYKSYDGTNTLKTVTCLDGVPQEAAPSIPSRSQTAQYTYTAVGWNTMQDAQAAEYPIAGPTTGMQADATLYAAYSRTVRTYTVTWKNSDGTVLETDNNVPYGSTPQYNGSTPQNPTSGGGAFQGWIPAVSNVTGNVTYTASYVVTYTVYFYNGSELLQTATGVAKGGSATYTGSTPVKTGVDNPEEYTFNGWSPSPTNIQGNTSCYAQFQEPQVWYDEEITDSWDTILANIASGTFSYKPGNYKPLDLGTEGVVNMQIVGLNKDTLAAGGGNAATSWISKELLNTGHRMNPSRTAGTNGTGSIGGWEACEMRSYLRTTIKPLIQSNVRSAIKEVTKYSRIYNTSETAVNNVTSTDDVWIPSHREIFNDTSYETSGPVYSDGFTDGASRIKKKIGASSGSWWWLRSASTANYFRNVSSYGGSDYDYADNAYGVALGFCI